MANTSAPNTKASKSGDGPDPHHVHGAVFDRILSGTEALHDLQPGVLDHGFLGVLQRCRKLSVLGIDVRERIVQQGYSVGII